MNTKLIMVILALAMFSANAMSLHSHEGLYAWYTYNEGPTRNKCKNAKQCTVREAVEHRDIAQGFPDQPRVPITFTMRFSPLKDAPVPPLILTTPNDQPIFMPLQFGVAELLEWTS